MSDPFASHAPSLISVAFGAFVIAPSDDADLPVSIRAVTIGGEGGTISFISRDGQTYTTGHLWEGCTYGFLARRILATGTTATGLTGWV